MNRMNPVATCLVLTAVFSHPFTLQAVQGRQDEKEPVPDEASQKKAEKLIQEVYEEEYSKTSRGDRQALAKKLIEEGIKTQDDRTAQFVLFRTARDFAAEACDPMVTLRAIREMALRFEIDADSMKLTALQKAGKKAKTPEQSNALGRAFLKLAESAGKSRDYETATKAANAAASFARGSKDIRLAARAKARSKELTELRKIYLKVKEARKVLSTKPDDGAAQLAIGRFLCMFEGNWEKGLPHLKKCEDSDLRALAEMDMTGSEDAAGKARIGDGWWKRGEQESGVARYKLRGRAVRWYREALEGLSGLKKMAVKKRLGKVAASSLARLGGSWVDITDGKRWGLDGERGKAIEVIPSSKSSEYIMLRKFPAGDFDGFSARIDMGSNKRGQAKIIFSSSDPDFYIDAAQDLLYATHWEGGSWVTDGRVECSERDVYFLTIVIEGGEYVVYLDGEEKMRFRARAALITDLTLKADQGPVVFDQIKLRKNRR